MKLIYSEKLPRILKNKKQLEKKLNVKITNNGNDVFINGEAPDEYDAEQVIIALNLGFPFSIAISIKEEELMLEVLNIKAHTKRHDFNRIRARIIGKNGKTIKTVSQLTDCFLELKNNEVGIIGSPENIKIAHAAIISLIKGTKQNNVYSYLEKHQPEEIFDYGIKKIKKK